MSKRNTGIACFGLRLERYNLMIFTMVCIFLGAGIQSTDKASATVKAGVVQVCERQGGPCLTAISSMNEITLLYDRRPVWADSFYQWRWAPLGEGEAQTETNSSAIVLRDLRPGTTYIVKAQIYRPPSSLIGVPLAKAGDGVGWVETTITTEGISPVCDGGEGVYLYEHNNYGGTCMRLVGDVSNPRWWPIGNDTVSSLKLVGCFRTTLYENDNFQGRSTTFSRDDSDLTNNKIGNDALSSIRVAHC